MSHGGHNHVSDSEEAVALLLVCARRRESQDELIVQRNLCEVKWWRLATMRAVTGLNSMAAGKASKIRARLSCNQSRVGLTGEGT